MYKIRPELLKDLLKGLFIDNTQARDDIEAIHIDIINSLKVLERKLIDLPEEGLLRTAVPKHQQGRIHRGQYPIDHRLILLR